MTQKKNRKYLPTLSELIDRLSISQLKEVFIVEHKEEYAQEISDILHDIQLFLDEQDDELEEEVDIKVADIDSSAEDKFIDIDPTIEPEPEPEDDFGIEGQDPTGRAFAQDAFNNIEKNIAETYAILHDEEDEKLFKDYLVTNLKLYFDKWEKELGSVIEPTTSEYEDEKDEQEIGAEFDAELGTELEDNPLD